LLWHILNAAMAVTDADHGNVQVVCRDSGQLRIVAQQGFEPAFLDYFDTVAKGTAACGAALRAGYRIIVPDVKTAPEFSAAARTVMLDANARAVQSTPVLDRAGAVIGMISTHFQTPHRPGSESLRLLDALAHSVGPILVPAALTVLDQLSIGRVDPSPV
jgi:GAF domain-containing protein